MVKKYIRIRDREVSSLGLLALLLSVLILALVIGLVSCGGSKTAGADALWDGGWYGDELGRIDGDRALVNGMKTFEKRTGVRPYLYLTEGVEPWGLDAFANAQYEALFGDGDFLLVVYDEWGEDAYYLSARAGAGTGLGDEAGAQLLACLEEAYADPENKTYADAFGAGFVQGADRIAPNPTHSWAWLLLVLGMLLGALGVLVLRRLRKKSRIARRRTGAEG